MQVTYWQVWQEMRNGHWQGKKPGQEKGTAEARLFREPCVLGVTSGTACTEARGSASAAEWPCRRHPGAAPATGGRRATWHHDENGGWRDWIPAVREALPSACPWVISFTPHGNKGCCRPRVRGEKAKGLRELQFGRFCWAWGAARSPLQSLSRFILTPSLTVGRCPLSQMRKLICHQPWSPSTGHLTPAPAFLPTELESRCLSRVNCSGGSWRGRREAATYEWPVLWSPETAPKRRWRRDRRARSRRLPRPFPREVVGGTCQDAADGNSGVCRRDSVNKRLVTPSGSGPAGSFLNNNHVKLILLLGQPPSHPLLRRGSRSERHPGLLSGTCNWHVACPPLVFWSHLLSFSCYSSEFIVVNLW